MGKSRYRKVTTGEAVRILRSGGLIVYPTDTAYGLGCDATYATAVKKIFSLKGRNPKKPLATIAASEAMVREYFRLDEIAADLARRHWPGALTLILPITDSRLKKALGLRAAGVRVPASASARKLSAALGRPIVSTSANRSGGANRYSARTALISLGADVAVVDGGVLPRRRPSTVVVFKKGKAIVLRQGTIELASGE
jgi:L-threonylcarbamoyladenylate synthase